MSSGIHPPPTARIDPGAHREALERTLPGRLALWAWHRPGGVALREKDLGRWREITWREYYEHVRAVGMALLDAGVQPGDSVSIHSENCPEWLFVDLAVQGIGARSVGVYQTSPPEDVAYLLSHSGAVIHFAEDQEQVDKAVEIADETPNVRQVVVFDPRGTHRITDSRLTPWQDFLARGFELAAAQPDAWLQRVLDMDPEEPSMVVYTSGTTGRPKGAMLSSSNALASLRVSGLLGYDADDLILSYLPLCHVAEKIFSVFVPLGAGCVVHFGESIETIRADLREVSPTVFLGVPRIWEKMHASVTLRIKDSSWLKRKIFEVCTRWGRQQATRRESRSEGLLGRARWFLADLLLFRALQEQLGLRRCRMAVSGAAPIAPEILQWFHSIGVPVREGFGQTESAGISHVNIPRRNRLGSVGEVIPGHEHGIAEDGEVLIRGPAVFCGYLHDAEATARTVDAEGWLHTGDLGRIDDDGYLWITGRKKELIITSGGKNLSPETIENALKTSPYIHEAVAVGDGLKFVSALVQIDYGAVADWATRRSIPYTSFGDLAKNPEVLKLLDGEIHRCNDTLPRVAQVRAFRTFSRELNEDDGELTATRKVRRRNVVAAWGHLVDEIYGGARG